MNILKGFVLVLIAFLMIYGSLRPEEGVVSILPEKPTEEVSEADILETVMEEPETEVEVYEEYVEEEYVELISAWEAELIALVTYAEAGIEPELGQRLVIDTILNRVDSPQFPNDIYSVIYQEGQFSCIWDGRIEESYVDNDILNLVYEEVYDRSNYDVHFFRTRMYSVYGEALFQVGHHYFSK